MRGVPSQRGDVRGGYHGRDGADLHPQHPRRQARLPRPRRRAQTAEGAGRVDLRPQVFPRASGRSRRRQVPRRRFTRQLRGCVRLS